MLCKHQPASTGRRHRSSSSVKRSSSVTLSIRTPLVCRTVCNATSRNISYRCIIYYNSIFKITDEFKPLCDVMQEMNRDNLVILLLYWWSLIWYALIKWQCNTWGRWQQWKWWLEKLQTKLVISNARDSPWAAQVVLKVNRMIAITVRGEPQPISVRRFAYTISRLEPRARNRCDLKWWPKKLKKNDTCRP